MIRGIYRYRLSFLWPFLVSCIQIHAQSAHVTIIDSSHYSNTFGEIRNYRVFLPPGYDKSEPKKYPVIYFLHGWSQRSFGDGAEGQWTADSGSQNNGDNIAKFASTHDVIVVKSDGYNRDTREKYYVRPYNIAPVETHRQFPIYFTELIDYIDNHYRTISRREKRAICGLSMGGFMSYWIGGKYPHLFSAIGSFCGSVELEVGPKDFPVEYRHIDMYKNYDGTNVRLNYGNKDFIRSYHRDLENVWCRVMPNFTSKIYDADHSSCGLNEMFDYIMKTFDRPPSKPVKWNHIDVYPDFSVWDYQVISDRSIPGFTILENVDKRGFRCAVREFVPNGEILQWVNVTVTTAPVYEKNQLYRVNDIDLMSSKATPQLVRSDSLGRLKIFFNGRPHEIGINKIAGKANICIKGVEIKGRAKTMNDVSFEISLINKGIAEAKNIKAKLLPANKTTSIISDEALFGNILVNEVKQGQSTFAFRVNVDSIEIERFKLNIQDGSGNEWTDFFDIPLKRDAPELKEFVIADGKTFTVAKSGNDMESVFLGKGNGDGLANPGESIVILVKDGGKYWRTDLDFSDQYVNPFGINKREADDWSNFDWVGASAKYSVPLISSDCPQNHEIEFYVEYWLPDHPLHVKKSGIVKLKVSGNDNTSPDISWTKAKNDNTLEVLVHDGSSVRLVRATLIRNDDPTKTVRIELADEGHKPDRVSGDNVFSAAIPPMKFGFYRIVIEAVDSFGNRMVEEENKLFVLH